MDGDQELFDRMGHLLGARPDWHYEPSPTPGGPPSWCLDPGGRVVLAATVADGVVSLYFPEEDRERALGDLVGLADWLEAHESQYRDR